MSTKTITIPGFEAAFSVLDGFNFATERDRTNALLLMHWLHMVAKSNQVPHMPAVMLSGPPGGGKTELLRRFIEAAGIPAEHNFAKVEAWCFNQVAPQRPKVVCFDLGGDGRAVKQALESVELQQWVRSGLWTVRKLGDPSEKQYGINCVTVLMTSASRGLEYAADVYLHIRLKARKEAGEPTAEG